MAPRRRSAAATGFGSGSCSTRPATAASTSKIRAVGTPPGAGALLLDDRSVPAVSVEHQLEFYEGGRRVRQGSFTLVDPAGTRWPYDFQDLGWVYCQGGGYFGGFDDGLGQGVYRGDMHVEGEVWDVRHPTMVMTGDGRQFEFEHAWAESFVRLTRPDGETGLAHFECVVVGSG